VNLRFAEQWMPYEEIWRYMLDSRRLPSTFPTG